MRYLRWLFMLLLFFSLVFTANSQPLPWANQEFYYEAKDESLPDLLTAFCMTFNTAAVSSPSVTGTVNGVFRFRRAVDFMEGICRAHGLTWYYDGTTVFFDKLSEQQNVMVRLRWITPQKLRSSLSSLGVLDTRFPWRAIEEERLVNLSGPPRYVETILGMINDMEKSASQDMQMQVFRLKHAWADDFTINNQGTALTIPGVATLLRNITGEGGIAPSTRQRPTNPAGLRGQGLARTSANNPMGQQPQQAGPMQADAASGPVRILADPRLNAVIVWDVRERMAQYAGTIEKLDQPVQLVEIQAAIMEVNVNKVAELGVSWSGRGRTSNIGGVGGINAGTSTNPIDFDSPYGSGLNLSTIYSHGLDFLMARVHALEETGDASVLSRPKVLTLDNMQASLEHVSTFYVRVAGYEQVDLFDVTYGTVLKVTPHVERGPDGRARIRMFVQVDDGSNQSNITQQQVDDLPVIGKSSIKTQAVVTEEQTLVIGGYYYEKRNTKESGVPLLMHIPYLGRLFKTNTDEVQKIERLFAIAPRLVDLSELSTPQTVQPDVFTRDLRNAQTVSPPPTGGCSRTRRTNSAALPQTGANGGALQP